MQRPQTSSGRLRSGPSRSGSSSCWSMGCAHRSTSSFSPGSPRRTRTAPPRSSCTCARSASSASRGCATCRRLPSCSGLARSTGWRPRCARAWPSCSTRPSRSTSLGASTCSTASCTWVGSSASMQGCPPSWGCLIPTCSRRWSASTRSDRTRRCRSPRPTTASRRSRASSGGSLSSRPRGASAACGCTGRASSPRLAIPSSRRTCSRCASGGTRWRSRPSRAP